jgi:hypothetical protein
VHEPLDAVIAVETGRMYSSVVGQYRLALQTETTDGFQVTSELER